MLRKIGIRIRDAMDRLKNPNPPIFFGGLPSLLFIPDITNPYIARPMFGSLSCAWHWVSRVLGHIPQTISVVYLTQQQYL